MAARLRLLFCSTFVALSLWWVGCERQPTHPDYVLRVYTHSMCRQCQLDKPIVKSLKRKVHVVTIDSRALQKKHGISVLPTYVLIKDGHVVLKTHRIRVVTRAL